LVPKSTPALKATINNGHIGSYYQKYGGKMGKAAVALFKWRLKDDGEAKWEFCNTDPVSPLVELGFKIESKNGMC
jgi:hypothetical protein